MSGPTPAAPGATTSLDPQAAIAKHAAITQGSSEGDAAIVHRIEAQIANSPMGRLQAMLGDAGSKASAEKGAIDGKVAEQQEAVSKNQKDAPPDAGAAPRPGPATHPAVSTKGGDTKAGPAASKGGGGAAGGPAADKKAGGKTISGGPKNAHVDTPEGVAGAMSGAGNDAQLAVMLNAYSPKSAEPTEMVSRIKQMKGIADGFNGQLDVYVAQGGAVEQGIAAAANFLGQGKDVSAIWATNPYRQVGGILGGIMTGISAVKQVAGVVGSICGKLGLLLTVIGLLGMIFPPIGVAVSGIARILNAVGLICDVISFVLSAILMGLNGVHLAQQAASGASAEEKAATADLMMSEANSAAGGLISLAMQFGPKFMKGLLGNSRGVLNSLIRRFKSVVQRVTLRLTGNVKNIANKLLRKIGLGGAGGNIRVGGAWKANGLVARTKEAVANSKVGKLAQKVYRSPAAGIDKLQDITMKKWGTSALAKRLDRVGAWSGSMADKIDLDKNVGNWLEKKGSTLGAIGADTKLGKKWANAADASELETRRTAMELAQKDAMHLEEARWNRQLAERAEKQKANGGSTLSDDGRDKFVASRSKKVGDKHQADFDEAEAGRSAAANAKRKAKNDADDDLTDYAANRVDSQGRSHRDTYMDEVHKSREKRWKLEKVLETKEAERRQLLAVEKRDAAQEARLTALNEDAGLKMLDAARTKNTALEASLSQMAGHKQTEVHTLADIKENVDGTLTTAAEMLHLKEERSAWRKTEKNNLRKQIKWDAGSASAGAARRGGSGTYADIQSAQQQQQRADFAAFVAKGRPTPTVAQTARNMLSSIRRDVPAPANTNAPAPGATTATPTPTPQPTATPTPATTATPAMTAGQQPQPPTTAPDPAATPQQTGLPDPVAEPDEGGEAELPYWPDVVSEFDKGMHDFGYMRKVATEFKKAQIQGKQKAVDTLAVYGQYEEYAAKRAEHAKKNEGDARNTQKDTQANSSSANASESQGSQGAAKQEEARGAANNRAAVDIPEPESRGFWGKILGQFKRWAKQKAGELFGYIQEKIASAILSGLCGVSMGDMRDYAGALRRQQIAATGVAGTAASTSTQAASESIKLGGNAQKEAQSAADSIGECDNNILEADKFVADVTSFEAQLSQEKAHAQAFLAQVTAAFHTEQERKKAEAEAAKRQQEQEAAEQAAQAAQAQQASADPTNDTNMSIDTAQSSADQGPNASVDPGLANTPAPEPEEDPELAAREGQQAKIQIVATADYIKSSGEQFHVQVQGRAEDYTNQLKLALTNRTGESANGDDLMRPAKRDRDVILDDFRQFVESTKRDLDQINSVTIDPSSAGRIADQVISIASTVDAHYDASMTALDQLFDATYRGIRDGERTLASQVLDGDNAIGEFNRGANDVQDQALDQTMPAASTAWTWMTPGLR